MPAAGKHLLLIVVLASITFFTNLGGPRLWDRDEPRNAGCALEMIERSDWVVPMFNAELRIHKPVLLYWFMMSAYAMFGENEFAARFFSALLAVGTVAMTYAMGRRMFSARAGLWAAIVLSTTLMFNVAARAATPDSVLIFFSTLALLIYVYNVEWGQQNAFSDLFPQKWSAILGMYSAMGIAILAKGPVGLVLPTAVIGMYLLIRTLPDCEDSRQEASPSWWGRLQTTLVDCLRPFAPRHFLVTCWNMRLLTATVVALLIAAPWYIWVGLRTDGAWLHGFFVEHNVQRAATAMEGHSGSLLYYPVATLLGFFPWSIFAVPLLLDSVGAIRRKEKESPGYLFALCWGGVFIGLFSVARTKLPSYVTPMYPGLALASAAFMVRWLDRRTQLAAYWPRICFGCLIAAGLLISVGLGIALHLFTPGAEYLASVGLIPIATGIAAWKLFSQDNRLLAGRVLAGGAFALVLSMFAFGAGQVDRHRHDQHLLAAIQENHDDPKIAAFRQMEGSWVFYLRRPIEALPGETTENAANYLRDHENGYVITQQQFAEDILADAPGTVRVLADIPKFLEPSRVVVIGRPAKATYTAKKVLDERKLR